MKRRSRSRRDVLLGAGAGIVPWSRSRLVRLRIPGDNNVAGGGVRLVCVFHPRLLRSAGRWLWSFRTWSFWPSTRAGWRRTWAARAAALPTSRRRRAPPAWSGRRCDPSGAPARSLTGAVTRCLGDWRPPPPPRGRWKTCQSIAVHADRGRAQLRRRPQGTVEGSAERPSLGDIRNGVKLF